MCNGVCCIIRYVCIEINFPQYLKTTTRVVNKIALCFFVQSLEKYCHRSSLFIKIVSPQLKMCSFFIVFAGLQLYKWSLLRVVLKGYLRYKTITSQNMSNWGNVLFHSYVRFSRHSSFFISNHPMIYQICDVMMSTSIWERVHLWIYLLNSLSHQIWPLDSISRGNNFQDSFE